MTCPRCGQPARPDTKFCTRCGAPMAQGDAPGVTESGIPVWLKQLQAQQGHAAQGPQAPQGTARPHPNVGAGQAPASSLVSEDALPAWLRNDAPAAGSGAGQNGGQNAAYGAGVPFPPPAVAPSPVGQGQMAGSSSVIDESALPSWLRQANGAGAANSGYGGAAHEPGGYPPMGQPPYQPAYPVGPAAPNGYGGAPGAAPGVVPGGVSAAAGAGAGAGMAVGSLIDEGALPDWMQQPNAARPQAASVNGANASRREGTREGMDARSLVDDTSLPQWLRGGQQGGANWSQGGAGQAGAPVAAPGAGPAWTAQAPGPSATPFAPPPASAAAPTSVSTLVDDSALPPWLRAQGLASPSSQAIPPAPPAPQAPLDPSAVPPWARSRAGQPEATDAWASGQEVSPAAPQAARQPADSAWLTDAGVPAAGGAAGASGSMPAWLRNAQQAASQPSSNSAGGSQTEDLPPWLRQGAPGQAANAPTPHGRVAPENRGPDPRDFSASRVRTNDPRQAAYGGQGYPRDEWQENGQYPFDGYDDEQGDERGDRGQRRGIFGFLRRR